MKHIRPLILESQEEDEAFLVELGILEPLNDNTLFEITVVKSIIDRVGVDKVRFDTRMDGRKLYIIFPKEAWIEDMLRSMNRNLYPYGDRIGGVVWLAGMQDSIVYLFEPFDEGSQQYHRVLSKLGLG
jgi:hypothetical protein